MIEEVAHVIAVSPTEFDSDKQTHRENAIEKIYQVTLESEIKSSCGSCSQIDTCGTGQISKALPQRQTRFTLHSTIPIKVGDKVIIGLSEQALLTSAWQVYLWPVLGLILMATLSLWALENTMLSHELYSLLLGSLGAFLGHKFACYKQNKSACAEKMKPQILRITTNEDLS
jgi:sigma-E factor negative regulatory protein RseC